MAGSRSFRPFQRDNERSFLEGGARVEGKGRGSRVLFFDLDLTPLAHCRKEEEKRSIKEPKKTQGCASEKLRGH